MYNLVMHIDIICVQYFLYIYYKRLQSLIPENVNNNCKQLLPLNLNMVEIYNLHRLKIILKREYSYWDWMVQEKLH